MTDVPRRAWLRRQDRLARKAFIVLALAVAVLATLPSPAAQGDNFRNNCYGDLPCKANDGTHILSYQLGPRLRLATERTRVNSYDTTDMTVILGDNANADVIYYNNDDMRVGVAGQYYCTAMHMGNYYCNKAQIHYHGDMVVDWHDNALWKLACHETGHSVGLTHPSDIGAPDDQATYQCMAEGGINYYLGTHNTGHVNATY